MTGTLLPGGFRRRQNGRDASGRGRGQSLVEFALVFPILALVLFGTLQYGLYFFDTLGMRQGVREAARQGVVENYGDQSSCGMTYATTPSANIAKLMCRAETDVNAMTGDTSVKVLLPGGWVRGQELVVCGMIKADRLPGLVPLPEDRMIRWSSRMSIEVAAPRQTETGGAEVLPAGASWTWCA